METLYSILNQDGERRVVFYRDADGTFRFEEQFWAADPLERCWIPTDGSNTSICASEEIAWREALGTIPWLRDVTG